MTINDEPDKAAEANPAAPPRLPRFGAVAAGLVSLFLVSSLFFLFPFGLFVAPLGLVPILHFQSDGSPGIRAWGWIVGLLAIGSAVGLAGVPLVLLASYSLVVVIPALSIEIWSKVGATEERWVVFTVAITAVALLSGIALVSMPAGPVAGVAELLREGEETAKEMYGSIGVGSGEIELAYDAAIQIMPWILPGFIIAYFLTVLFWVRPRIPILGYDVEVGPFEAYRNDEWLAGGFAVAGLGALFLTGTPRWLALNLLIAVLLLYFVQGLAMIRAHLARWVGRGWFVRWGVALMCIYPPMPILVATLGVADSFFPLRPAASDDGGNA